MRVATAVSRSVLVVDDHPLVREVLRTMLEARAIKVMVAKDGHEALERFSAEQVAVALVDVDMPGPNGIEVCRALRAHAAQEQRSLAVWLMTGVHRPELIEPARMAGALGILEKPFSTEALVQRVEAMLAEAPVAA